MIPAFSEVQFAVIYFPIDKSFMIYDTEDIIGWNEDQYEGICRNERSVLQTTYDLIKYKVWFRAAIFKNDTWDVVN